MYGIPNMKLEKEVIDRKISIMKEEGVEFKTGVNVGKDVKAKNCLTNTTELYSAAAHPTQEILRLKAEKLKAFTLLLIFLNQLLSIA